MNLRIWQRWMLGGNWLGTLGAAAIIHFIHWERFIQYEVCMCSTVRTRCISMKHYSVFRVLTRSNLFSAIPHTLIPPTHLWGHFFSSSQEFKSEVTLHNRTRQCALGPILRPILYLWCPSSNLDMWEHYLHLQNPLSISLFIPFALDLVTIVILTGCII